MATPFIFVVIQVEWETVMIANIEDQAVEESKEKKQEDSKKDPLLEDLQRKEDQHDDLPNTWKYVRDHPIDQVIGDPIQGMRTIVALKETCEYAAYISQLEPKNFKEAEMKKARFWSCKKN